MTTRQQRGMSFWAWSAGVATLAAAFKGVLLAVDAFPFHADEAIVGLMAKHMLEGEWPAFFYGQAYMGSLDATLVALGFSLFGPQIEVIRAIQVLLYGGTVVSTMLLARQIFGSVRTATIAGLLMALPAVNTTLYTTISLGGYGEALLIGNLLMLLALGAGERREKPWIPALWGALAGLGFWGFGLTLVFTLPSGLLLLSTLWRDFPLRLALARMAQAGALFLLGALPWGMAAMRQGIGPFLLELAGAAIAGASPSSLPQAIGSHLINLLIFGSTVILGIRPPWEIRWLAWPLLPLIVLFWSAAMAHLWMTRGTVDRARPGRRLLVAVGAITLAGFILTPFGADPSGRYFLPLTVPMALIGAEMLARLGRRIGRFLTYGWLVAVLGFNVWGTLDSARRQPPGITTQFNPITRVDQSEIDSLIEFLEAEQELRGYTNYWVSYPLAFLSQERLVYVPRLPYRSDFRYTERDDRYAPYGELVEESERIAYITTHHSQLDSRIRESLHDAGVTWEEASFGDFQVFYRLSQPVRPDRMRLQRNGE